MSADWSKPTTTDAYADVLTELGARLDDLAKGLDPAVVTPTNIPTNAIRWNSALGRREKYNGSTWEALVAAEGDVISSAAVSGASAIITGLTGYGGYKLRLRNLVPITSNQALHMQVSLDGGSTWESAAYPYEWAYWGGSSAGVSQSLGGDTKIVIMPGVSNTSGSATNGGLSCDIQTCGAFDVSAQLKAFTWKGLYSNTSHDTVNMDGMGTLFTAGVIDAVKFFFASGNISSGNITLIGTK